MYCGGQKDEDEKTLSGRESFVERGAKAVMPQACLPLQPGTASQMIFMMTRVEEKLGSLTDWEHGPPLKITDHDFKNFFKLW